MMVGVADNEHPREQPAAPPPADPAPPPAVRPPTEVTPEQVRQFQEFQQFQAMMREQAEKGLPQGTPPPPGFLQPWGPPPPKQSLPKRLLKAAIGKIVTGLVVLLVLAAAGYFAIDYFLGEDQDQLPASQTGGGKTDDNLVLDGNPYETVRKVYHHIANGEHGAPEQVCLRFEDRGAKFARDLGYSTCREAVTDLAEQVTDSNAYAESMPSYTTKKFPESSIRISSCADNVRGGIQGGPALGAFTVEKIPGSKGPNGQWRITDHENEPPCSSSPSTAPSN